MIDRNYADLARDRRERTVLVLDTLNAEAWTFVDVRWTLKRPHLVRPDNKSCPWAGNTRKPSDGLEPSTPSLPSAGRTIQLPALFFVIYGALLPRATRSLSGLECP